MGREKILFKSEEKKSSVEVVAVLRSVADKIEQGSSMTLRQGKDKIVLDFPKNMTLEIKVEDEEKKRKGTKRTFEIELEWYPGSGHKESSVTIE
ncbi:MAG: amphi-Trp domain-containing protein [Proteobacteria bacterium]|nr:amphi-Trp domain-containing protein [Pseudomonadota bacterium]MBU1057630.1 amphi-Trp domain-containing protein [Pseudomonadota bacterium]